MADNIHRHLSAIGSDAGALFSEAHIALDDGIVTPQEAGRMKRETVKLASALSRFTARLNRILHTGKGRRK